jgi:hypothetical protein
MKRYDKNKRLKIYKRALLSIKSQEEDSVFGLCHSLCIASKIGWDGIFNISIFPEIISKKPEKTYSDCRWFNIKDRDSRVKILESAIKEIES